MPNSMTAHIFCACLLLLRAARAVDADDHPVRSERAALVSLRRTLNNSLIAANWTGPHCSSNATAWAGLRCADNRVTSIALESAGLSFTLDDALVLASFTELTSVSFRDNAIGGSMMDFSRNPKVTSIDLSMNRFTGRISESLLALGQLRSLQLHHNYFDGGIPPFGQRSLEALDVSYNLLTGEIPNTAVLRAINGSSYTGNPGLCGVPSPNPCPTTKTKKKKKGLSSMITYTIIAVVVVVLLILLSSVYLFKRRRRAGRGTTKGESGGVAEEENVGDVERKELVSFVSGEQRQIVFVDKDVGFELKDLLKSSAEVLGKGSFGGSYKAVMEDGREFVVKRLKDVSPLTSAEFARLMGDLAALEHPNLFPLVGYSYSMDEKLLIYKSAPNGNLFDRIHGCRGENTRVPFRWASRLSVAKAIARGMRFLHHNTKGTPESIPHGNLKSSNVLLGGDNRALVADYGLLPLLPAPLAPPRMVAYRSPEYQFSRKVCRKSDVWSYGCILLELLTGKIPAHSAPQGTQGVELVNWVHRSVREEWTFEVFDPEISTQRGSMRGMFSLLRVALWCCERSLEKRPEMEEVARKLDGIVPIEEEEEAGEEEEEQSTDVSFGEDSVSIDASRAVV